MIDKQSIYLKTIREAYPDLDICTARLHTGEGLFNDILILNDDLIFRFPRYEESIVDFLREIQVLQKLKGHVRLPIPDPIYVRSQTPSVGQIFMGYKILPGKPLFRDVLNAIKDDTVLETFAWQLGNFLHGLHTLSPAALELNLPVSDPLAQSTKLFSDIEEQLFPFMRAEGRSSVEKHFEDYLDDLTLHEYEASIIHGDFGGSNILFEGNLITGVIDFSSTQLNDPAIDLAALSTLGESFFARVCSDYPLKGNMLERAKFYRGTYALQEALHGFHNHDEQAFKNGMEQYV